jgi:hypothetical protein
MILKVMVYKKQFKKHIHHLGFIPEGKYQRHLDDMKTIWTICVSKVVDRGISV